MAAKRKPPDQQKPPAWVSPQLALLVKEAPEGDAWLHEIKYDGYRLHARVDGNDIALSSQAH